MKKIKILTLLILLLAIVLGAVYFIKNKTALKEDNKENNIEKVDNYVGRSAEECSRIQVVCVAGFERFDNENGCGCQPIAIPTNWKLYSSDIIGFSIQYDPSLTVSEDNNTDVRFYKNGPTQKGQTEMFDGIIVTFRKISVTDGGLSYINAQMEQYKNVGTITELLHDDMLNGIPVKEYSAIGVGNFKIIFVPINNETLLEISYMAPDPTSLGFQKTVDTMLSTFKLIDK